MLKSRPNPASFPLGRYYGLACKVVFLPSNSDDSLLDVGDLGHGSCGFYSRNANRGLAFI